MNLTSRDSLEK